MGLFCAQIYPSLADTLSSDLAHLNHFIRHAHRCDDALPRKYDSLCLERTLADYPLDHLQLTRLRRAGDGHFSNHALTRIVRLTIETNILTSKSALDSGYDAHYMLFQPQLQSYRC